MMIQIDYALFNFFNGTCANPFFDWLMPIITDETTLIAFFAVSLIVFIILSKDRRQALIYVGLAVLTLIAADLISHRLLKPLFFRLRPCHPDYFVDGIHVFLEHGRFLLGENGSLSFPSTHAVTVGAQAMLWSLLYPKKWIYFTIFAIVIAYSRIYVGVHYPFDALFGLIFGALIGAAVVLVYRFCSKKQFLQSGFLRAKKKID